MATSARWVSSSPSADFPAAPDATFFVCQHLAEDVLYQPSYLEHSNGALGIGTIVAVAEKPEDFREMLTVATGQSELTTIEAGVKAEADGQSFLILTREGFRARYDLDPPNPRRGLLFAAFEMSVLDLDRAARYAGSSAKRHEDRIVVPAAPGLGAVIAFRRSSGWLSRSFEPPAHLCLFSALAVWRSTMARRLARLTPRFAAGSGAPRLGRR